MDESSVARLKRDASDAPNASRSDQIATFNCHTTPETQGSGHAVLPRLDVEPSENGWFSHGVRRANKALTGLTVTTGPASLPFQQVGQSHEQLAPFRNIPAAQPLAPSRRPTMEEASNKVAHGHLKPARQLSSSSQERILRRLARDASEILERVKAGERRVDNVHS